MPKALLLGAIRFPVDPAELMSFLARHGDALLDRRPHIAVKWPRCGGGQLHLVIRRITPAGDLVYSWSSDMALLGERAGVNILPASDVKYIYLDPGDVDDDDE